MTRYTVFVERKAQRQLQRLDTNLQQRVDRALQALEDEPKPGPPRAKPLRGFENDVWSYRVGNWRIIYVILEATQEIVIARIGPRGSVYRNL